MNRRPVMPQAAMVLAAGLGLRMRPLTDSMPKPLIPVAGKPLISHLLELLSGAQIQRVVINAHYFADQIKQFVTRWTDIPLLISDESSQLLDSGGGVKKALPLIDADPLFVLNADSFWIDGPRSNLYRLAEAWNPDNMDILLLVASGSQVTGYSGAGDFIMDPMGRLTRRAERVVAPFVYAGVAIMKSALFANTPDGPFSLNYLFNRAISEGRLFGLRLDGEWLHVGSPDAIQAAEWRIDRSIY